MDFDYIKIVLAVVLAATGWVVAHYFTARRMLASKRRDVTLEHLINAYRILTNEISHRTLDSERKRKFEGLLSDIQLFGSAEQVDLVCKLAEEVAAKQSFELDPLINNLRDDLRKQLQLVAASDNVKWLRFEGIRDKLPANP